ncbi:SH3 domain-containing protein [Streptomyces cavernae]|uniref:SH3 domain-containing protein n=1 Tax=Streptomyces cavernae TaxID=2259034 RepID=UPI001EE3DC4B|nr:SH3 domain-containing protein [Streptomyces cavernae]
MITNFRSGLRKYGVVSAALAAVAVPVALVATAAPASAAASCGRSGPNLDGTTVRQTAGVSANMRSGSSTNCAVRGWADNRDTLDYYCYTVNASGSTWTYLRNVTDGTYGWVSDDLLPNDLGSTSYCGF